MPASSDEIPTYPLPRGCPFDPPTLFAEKRRTEPIFKVRIWNGREAWVVTRHQDGRALLTDKRLSADSLMPGMPHQSEAIARFRNRRNFITMDTPEHKYYRRKIADDFGPKRMAHLRPAVERIVDDRIDHLLSLANPDLVNDFALPITSSVICELLGVPYEAHDMFEKMTSTLLSTMATSEQANDVNQQVTAFLSELFEEKLHRPTADVLTGLALRVASGELTRAEAINMVYLMLIAGHETTASQIGIGALVLMRHPEQKAELAADPSLAENAVEEILRYTGVSQAGRRRIVLADFTYNGTDFKAGDGVIVIGNSANRDDAVFEDPDVFDIRRANASQHVEFGSGTHICLGRPLARLELQVVFERLFQRTPTMEPALPDDELPFKHDAVVYGLASLPVRW